MPKNLTGQMKRRIDFQSQVSSRSFRDTTRLRTIGQSGQIVVEYILLLAVAVVIAALITKTMIGTDANNPGFVITAWRSLITTIGADHADDIDRGQ